MSTSKEKRKDYQRLKGKYIVRVDNIDKVITSISWITHVLCIEVYLLRSCRYLFIDIYTYWYFISLLGGAKVWGLKKNLNFKL